MVVFVEQLVETEVLGENLPQCISFFGSVCITDYADLSLINSTTFLVLNQLHNWALISVRWRIESGVQISSFCIIGNCICLNFVECCARKKKKKSSKTS
jgi:hypothetical protein